ncbi:hypothetical protein FNV43_RR09967 [Rhamnella rubrinervis]|uniref:Dof zinc finger protein n=1 Tax=Rhamnella rubrinervis TaxID=2594499 RepID=A0A8K0MKA1_9ROSA|nr:hypothetical protein FNV43_RR09967 [Rhamnella rubrinervis]
MVFSSIPAYHHHDPAANWQQQPNHSTATHHHGVSNSQLLPPPPPQPLPPPSHPHGVGGSGSIRPGSMADRARMANIPLPEPALKCPRCESTNTKFCYFNNYSLTQPRHFCKTCRRYWTRGGAMRNVPVGGGCRRNKRSKASSSKSPATSSDRQTGTPGSSSTLPSNTTAPDVIGLANQIPPLRLMAPFHQFTDFSGMGLNYGLNYGGISAAMVGGGDMNFQIGSSLGRLPSGSSFLSAAEGMDEQWRLQQAQQFPFVSAAGLDSIPVPPQPGIFESGVEALGYHHHHVRPKPSTSGVTRQLASVKMEENQAQELNLSGQFLGINNNNNPAEVDHHHQYWSGGNTSASAWTDLSGFSSSSATSNPL